MPVDFVKGIVHLPGGTGFVVSKDGKILTCAHVIAGCELGDQIDVEFYIPTKEPSYYARIIKVTTDQTTDDLALLQLEGRRLPEGVEVLPLGSSSGIDGHSVRSFGYPTSDIRPLRGVPGYGKAIGPQAHTDTGQPLIAIRSNEITRGFSGAPVWDDARKRVVGIVVMILGGDDYKKMREAAYATPTETIRSNFPELKISDESPYRKLNVFTEDDADYFFGRQSAIKNMLEKLRRQNRSLAVFGPSGSGKSSLVQAGLIPALRKGALLGSERWDFIRFRPSSDPFAQLASIGLDIPSRNLAEGAKAWQKRNPQLARLALVIDQFEELFVECTEPVRQDLVTQLAGLIDSELPVTVILAMRNDFYSSLAQYDTLMKQLNVENVLATLTEEELKDIICEPAKKIGLQLEENLPETIVNDAIAIQSSPQSSGRSASIAVLPLLEFTLSTLWEYRVEGMLTYKAYQGIGGVTGSLKDWGNEAYKAFADEEDRRLVRRIFIELVQPGDESQNTPNVRRRSRLVNLWRRDSEKERVLSIVRKLVTDHLLVTDSDTGISDAGSPEKVTVEIIHDVLLREWDLLKTWLKDNREFLIWRADLDNRLLVWLKTRATSDLLKGIFLSSSATILERYRNDLNPDESAFILASIQQENEDRENLRRSLAESERQRALLEQQRLLAEQRRIEAEQEREEARKQQRIAEQEREEARRQKQITERQKELALARQLVAQADLLRTQQGRLVQLSALLALEAVKRSPEANQALRLGLALLPRPVKNFQPDSAATMTALSSQGRYLLTANKDAPVGLWRMNSGSLIARLNHDTEVTIVKFSPDEYSAVTVGIDNSARVWETSSGRQLARLLHDGEIKEIALSPTGRSVAMISSEGAASIYMLDQQGARKLNRVGSRDITITAVTFSLDGHFYATARDDCIAQVWEITSGRLLANLKQNKRINALAFSPDGRFLSTIGDDPGVRLWFWRASDARPRSFTHDAPVNAIAFSPDGMYLATASKDQTARLWEITSGRQLHRLNHEDSVNAVMFSPGSRYLATTSGDRTVGIWETRSGYRLICLPHNDVDYREKDYVHTVAFTKNESFFATVSNSERAGLWEIVNTRLRHNKRVNMVAFSPDQRYLASGSDDSTAVVWETTNGRQSYQVSHEGNVWAVAFSPDGKSLATASKDGSARLTDLTGSRQLLRLAHASNVNIATFSPNGKYLATASDDRTAKVWDTASGNELFSLAHEDSVYSVIFNPTEEFLVTACGNGTARVWNTLTHQPVFSVAHKPIINYIAISPDGRYLATAGWNASAKIWSMTNGQELHHLSHSKTVWCVAFSHDSQYLATAGDDPVPRIWDVKTGQLYRSLPPHNGSVRAITFGPTSTYLATASADRTACVWGTTTGMQLAYLQHEDSVTAAAFSPDGTYLATASEDGTARIWTWQTKDLLAAASARLTRDLTADEWQSYIGDEPYRRTRNS